MSDIQLPIYVRIGDDEVQIGQLDVIPQVSATVNLNPSAMLTIRQTIQPEPGDE